MSQSLLPPGGEAEIEAQLRAAAPILPPNLRSRTLMRCAVERDAQRRNRRRGHLRWAWTIAGLCAFHWSAMAYLDGQSAALIHGKHSPPLVATTTSAAELRVALEAHSRLLAKMTQEPAQPKKASRDAG